jgi:hypothetical protein
MDFAIWLAICRPSGRPISAKSISKYLGQVRLWHLEGLRRSKTYSAACTLRMRSSCSYPTRCPSAR